MTSAKEVPTAVAAGVAALLSGGTAQFADISACIEAVVGLGASEREATAILV